MTAFVAAYRDIDTLLGFCDMERRMDDPNQDTHPTAPPRGGIAKDFHVTLNDNGLSLSFELPFAAHQTNN